MAGCVSRPAIFLLPPRLYLHLWYIEAIFKENVRGGGKGRSFNLFPLVFAFSRKLEPPRPAMT